MTIDALHSSFFDRVVALKVEQRPSLKMALEAGFRISARINDELAASSAHFQVEAAGAMTRFAALTLQALSFSPNPNAGVAGVFEILSHLFMAQGARFHTYVFSTLNNRRGHYHALHGRTGNNEYHSCGNHKSSDRECCLESGLLHASPLILMNRFITESQLLKNWRFLLFF
jgi:hypothetical protein